MKINGFEVKIIDSALNKDSEPYELKYKFEIDFLLSDVSGEQLARRDELENLISKQFTIKAIEF